jgi:hypothetical protein
LVLDSGLKVATINPSPKENKMNHAAIKTEVLERLHGFIKQVEQHGLNGLESIVADLDKEDALDQATDSLASGDLLGTIIFDTCDRHNA